MYIRLPPRYNPLNDGSWVRFACTSSYTSVQTTEGRFGAIASKLGYLVSHYGALLLLAIVICLLSWSLADRVSFTFNCAPSTAKGVSAAQCRPFADASWNLIRCKHTTAPFIPSCMWYSSMWQDVCCCLRFGASSRPDFGKELLT